MGGGGRERNLDFQKAYDDMEWNFLIATLKAFGFHLKFQYLVFQCVSTLSYSLLFNGSKEVGFHHFQWK